MIRVRSYYYYIVIAALLIVPMASASLLDECQYYKENGSEALYVTLSDLPISNDSPNYSVIEIKNLHIPVPELSFDRFYITEQKTNHTGFALVSEEESSFVMFELYNSEELAGKSPAAVIDELLLGLTLTPSNIQCSPGVFDIKKIVDALNRKQIGMYPNSNSLAYRMPKPNLGVAHLDLSPDDVDLELRVAVDDRYELIVLYKGMSDSFPALSYIHSFNNVSENSESDLFSMISKFIETGSEDDLAAISEFLNVTDERP